MVCRMAQAAFEFSPLCQPRNAALHRRPGPATAGAPGADAANGLDAVGFDIGWDHAHHRLTPPLRHLHDHNPVRQGWAAGRSVFGSRSLKPTVAVRQWLGLRLLAWQQGQVFEGVQVNAHFLARIDADECPISRQPLTLCAGLASDACISRLNLTAAYAAGNLVVLSQRIAAVHQGAVQPGQPAAEALLGEHESARLAVPHPLPAGARVQVTTPRRRGGRRSSRDRSSPLLLGRPGACRLHRPDKSKPCLSLQSRRVDAARV